MSSQAVQLAHSQSSMSVREEHDGSAFRMCSVILACREVFGKKGTDKDYDFLQNLLDEPGHSDKCKGLLDFEICWLLCVGQSAGFLVPSSVIGPSRISSGSLTTNDCNSNSISIQF